MDKLMARDEAPLTSAEWEAMDNAVVQTARRQLVARRFIDVYGPLGAGIRDITCDIYAGPGRAMVDAVGRDDEQPVESSGRRHSIIPLIYKDFIVYWRDLEAARGTGIPLDTAPAAAAAAFVAIKEDDLIFNGGGDLECPGLLTINGRSTVDVDNWDELGAAFTDITKAIQKLIDEDFVGPYAIALNPQRYAQLHRVFERTGVLEIEQVRDLAAAGVYQSPVIKDYGVVVSTGIQNLDIAIAQDIITTYLGPENLNHPFRVLESVVLRVKRQGAICTLESPGEKKGRGK